MTFTELVTESRRLVKATNASYPISEVTDSINRALERITTLIRQAQGRWQWDDKNNTDFPFATTSLFANQYDYELDINHYRVERFEVMDENGSWRKLKPFDITDVRCIAITTFDKGPGVPEFYDLVGSSVLLYPTPSYTQAASLKVFYERGPSYFTVADTTKIPGINPLFHRLISLWGAYDYALINQENASERLFRNIQVDEKALQDFYTQRQRDEHITISTVNRRNYFR